MVDRAFLPLSSAAPQKPRGGAFDAVLVTGDAYVDHPSYGTAVIGRVLQRAGFTVAVIAQPDWRKIDDFKAFGRPRLFFGITAGNLDSMVANYTASKRPRRVDDYSPGGAGGRRPDRAVLVYANRLREAFPGVPIVIGGIEASLRRFAHYDWWDNAVRRSILVDSRSDILVYGMGEMQVVEIGRRLRAGMSLFGIPGTAVIVGTPPEDQPILEIPSYEDVARDKDRFNQAFSAVYANQDPLRGATIAQKHANRYVIQFPPALPLSTKELDGIYELPYCRASHPAYDRLGGVPGFETVRHSLITHRGCVGGCSFCSLSMHQGRIVQSRSKGSIVREALLLTQQEGFRGTITDVGGPTANLYEAFCDRWAGDGACLTRHCLTPRRCPNLRLGYKASVDLLKGLRSLAGVKHVFIASGFRHDLLAEKDALPYLKEVLSHHVSGQMKVAPEHTSDAVLALMNKPPLAVYRKFKKNFDFLSKAIERKQFLVHYFISSHPGATLEEALALSLDLQRMGIYPEQIQDFMPLPLTLSGAIYYTGKDPTSGKEVYVPRTDKDRRLQRALLQYRHPENGVLVREALCALKKEHLMHIFAQRRQHSRSAFGTEKHSS